MTQDELFRDALAGCWEDSELPWPVRQLVLARDSWACLCCGRSVLGRAYAVQLRKPRHLDGPTSPENLITVLAACGDRIRFQGDPTDDASGYRLGSSDDPATVPVACFTPAGQTKAWLLPDGSRAFESPTANPGDLAAADPVGWTADRVPGGVRFTGWFCGTST